MAAKPDKLHERNYFGCRMERILKLKKLYSKSYFTDRVETCHIESIKKNSEQEERLKRMRKLMYLQEFERMKKYINVEGGGNILDIGCGEGQFLSMFNKKWKKFGIEISNYAKKIATKKGIITDFVFKDNFFDLIIFRGTIQHIPDPIYKIGECYYWLKKGGWIVFLATPNTNSPMYKLLNNLPMLTPKYNFLLPSDIMLKQILTNFGFKVMEFEYPYLGTPYENRIRDSFLYLLSFIKIRRKADFPYYRSVMECYAMKGEKNDRTNK